MNTRAQNTSTQKIEINNSNVTIINNYPGIECVGEFANREVSKINDEMSVQIKAYQMRIYSDSQKRSIQLGKSYAQTKELFEREIIDGTCKLTEQQQAELNKLEEVIARTYKKTLIANKLFPQCVNSSKHLALICEKMQTLVDNLDGLTERYVLLIQEIVEASSAKKDEAKEDELEKMMKNLSLNANNQANEVNGVDFSMDGPRPRRERSVTTGEIAANSWLWDYTIGAIIYQIWGSSEQQ